MVEDRMITENSQVLKPISSGNQDLKLINCTGNNYLRLGEMRHELAHSGISQLRYEIREIVAVARHFESMGIPIRWENIGDPVNKGEPMAAWIKDIVAELSADDRSYGYVDTMGVPETRAFIADEANDRGGATISKDDILFFNGLGDAVARIFGNMKKEARVIGPSPAYSTHSSAEAAHSGYDHLCYHLLPEYDWKPNLDELENKVKYNDSISGILLINPDNPTGAVYGWDIMKEIVRIARENDVFLLVDEIYTNIIYGGAEQVRLCDVIEDVPGISLRGISKEYPWPGSRCGWIEVYNKHSDAKFEEYAESLINAKRLEVCSTSLPQIAIPRINGDARYPGHLKSRASMFNKRANELVDILSGINGVLVNKPRGAFYATVVINQDILPEQGSLEVSHDAARTYLESIVPGVQKDKRLVYYLLAAKGICVVPLTGFYSNLMGFRVTLLEHDDQIRRQTWYDLRDALREYVASELVAEV